MQNMYVLLSDKYWNDEETAAVVISWKELNIFSSWTGAKYKMDDDDDYYYLLLCEKIIKTKSRTQKQYAKY